MVRETEKDNIPIRDVEIQNSDQSRLPTPSRQIFHHSEWSDSEDGKDDQPRAKPIDTQPSTSFASYASEATPLRQPNMYPKVLNLGRGRSKALLANFTSVIKECRCGNFINQTPQESEIAVVPPMHKTAYPDKIEHMDRVQIYEELPAQPRPRQQLANWTSVRLGNNPSRLTVDEITQGQQQWNEFNDNTHEQNHNRPSDETESVVGDPIYSDRDDFTSRSDLEDV